MANLTECVLGHKLRDLGPSLTCVILCKVLGFACMSNVDSYVIPPYPNWHIPLWHAYHCLPGNGKGSDIFIPK